ncbi:MAG: molybdenum ABC transporter ATP-binding protein [Candidatus Eremiobacterota bacterium]
MFRASVTVRRETFELRADLEFASGWVGVFGPSGSGKSTLLDCFSGLLRPCSGELWLGDRCLYSNGSRVWVPPEGRGIAHVFQEAALFPHLSVERNLRYGAPRACSQWDRVVALLDLGGLLARRPATLSGGEQRRVALGRALLSEPRMLLLDEPLANLDEQRRQRVLPYLLRLRGLGLPLVYVSHSLSEVAGLADRVVLLEDGRVVGQGAPAELLPATPAARAEGLDNLFELQVLSHETSHGITRARWGHRTLAMPLDPERAVGETFRAACRGCDLTLRPVGGDSAPSSARNSLAARVASVEARPDRTAVSLEVDGRRLVSDVTAEAVEELGLSPGCEVVVSIKSTSLRWLP